MCCIQFIAIFGMLPALPLVNIRDWLSPFTFCLSALFLSLFIHHPILPPLPFLSPSYLSSYPHLSCFPLYLPLFFLLPPYPCPPPCFPPSLFFSLPVFLPPCLSLPVSHSLSLPSCLPPPSLLSPCFPRPLSLLSLLPQAAKCNDYKPLTS